MVSEVTVHHFHLLPLSLPFLVKRFLWKKALVQ
jgi:hypothetical protein